MEDLNESSSIFEIYAYLADRTYHDVQALRNNWGFDGTIATLPGINQLIVPSGDIWQPTAESAVNIHFVGSPNSSKSTILSRLREKYPQELGVFPSLIPMLDIFARHPSICMKLFIDFEDFPLYSIYEGMRAELFFIALRTRMQIFPKDMPESRDRDHQLVNLALNIINKHLFEEQGIDVVKAFLQKRGITPDMTDEEKISRFLVIMYVRTKEDFIRLSFRDQTHLLDIMEIVFPEISFDAYISTVDYITRERDNPRYNQEFHSLFLKEHTDMSLAFLADFKYGFIPKLHFFDEDVLGALLYYYTNIAANRLNNPEAIVNQILGEANLWRSFKIYIEMYNVYHAIFFFFTYPEQSLQREGGRRGPIINETYLPLLYEQQLAIYSRLLRAEDDLPFIVAAVDATGTVQETYANFERCCNEVLNLAGRDIRINLDSLVS